MPKAMRPRKFNAGLRINPSRKCARQFLTGQFKFLPGKNCSPIYYSYMLKFIYCVRRHPSKSPEAFRKYWLENHGPLVRSFAKTLRAKRYVQSHTLDTPLNAAAQQPRGSKPAYDGITELWWDNAEDLIAALSSPEGQAANKTLAEDEARFCDLPNCSVFFTEEHTIFD